MLRSSTPTSSHWPVCSLASSRSVSPFGFRTVTSPTIGDSYQAYVVDSNRPYRETQFNAHHNSRTIHHKDYGHESRTTGYPNYREQKTLMQGSPKKTNPMEDESPRHFSYISGRGSVPMREESAHHLTSHLPLSCKSSVLPSPFQQGRYQLSVCTSCQNRSQGVPRKRSYVRRETPEIV